MAWTDFWGNEIKPTLDNLETYITNNYPAYSYSVEEINKLANKAYHNGAFDDEELFIGIILDAVEKNKEINDELMNYIREAYTSIVNQNNPATINTFKQYTRSSIESTDEQTKNYSYELGMNIINAFDDKSIALEFLNYVAESFKKENIGEAPLNNIKILMNYIPVGRQYYTDDRAFLSSAKELISNVDISELKYGEEEDIKRYVAKKIRDDKKANGVYDIDEASFADIDAKLEKFTEISKNVDSKIENLNQLLDEYEKATDLAKDAIKSEKIKQLKELTDEINKLKSQVRTDYLNILSAERQSLIESKDALLEEVRRECSKQLQSVLDKITELDNHSNQVADRIRSLETQSTTAINKAAADGTKALSDFMQNSPEFQRAVEQSQSSDEFVKAVERINKQLTTSQAQAGSTGIQTAGVIIPKSPLNDINRPIDNTVNYYLDKSIPFPKRWAKLMKEKEKDIKQNGAIYHDKFNEIAKFLMMGKTPYCYGPSGCGKTFTIEKQLAKLMGLDLTKNGYVLFEQDIIGYNNAGTGEYVPSNLYRCFKYGGIIFLDELDNGQANSTVVLNNFIGLKEGDYYIFPNGEKVFKHPNFLIITAGNTNGNGKTMEHNTRQKMDEAVLQRVIPIDVGYDNRVEKEILYKTSPAWYSFVENFRNALSADDSENTAGTITTRDCVSILEYLNAGKSIYGEDKGNNIFSNEEILQYEFIQTKDSDTLTRIDTYLDEYERQGELVDGAKNIHKLYKQLIKRKFGNEEEYDY